MDEIFLAQFLIFAGTEGTRARFCGEPHSSTQFNSVNIVSIMCVNGKNSQIMNCSFIRHMVDNTELVLSPPLPPERALIGPVVF